MYRLIVDAFVSGKLVDSFAVAAYTADASAAEASAVSTAPAISKAKLVVKCVPE